MFAVCEIGGHQYLVKEGDYLVVDKLTEEAGKSVMVRKVLLLGDEKGAKIGTPFLGTSAVELKVIQTGLSKKVRSFKMKSKKRYKRLKGHREPFTEVQVVGITA